MNDCAEGAGPAARKWDVLREFMMLPAYATHRSKFVQSLFDLDLREPIKRLSSAATNDVQQIAASLIELLAAYHKAELVQSNRSFFWALVGSGLGLLLFAIAVMFSLLNGLVLAAIVSLVAGAVVEVVSGVVFFLYGKASTQLSAFHHRLEVLQRYLLANSICESLTETERDRARAALIREIAGAQPLHFLFRPDAGAVSRRRGGGQRRDIEHEIP
jgi:hypothetical protein